jgi:hypothetical protein
VKRRIFAGQVILDQLVEIALVELVGDSLPGFEIESGLIESTSQALAVLRDEAWHQTPGYDGARYQQPIEQSA